MRRFVVLAHELSADAEINLDDLPGAGRLDLLCRCVTSALLLSHDIRTDVRIDLLVDGYVVRFDGSELRRLNPDERSTAALIRDALGASGEAIGAMAATASPGVSIRKGDLESVLEDRSDRTIVQLHAEGRPVVELTPPENPVFVLSDHREFTDRERESLVEFADERVSLGPRALHADGAITVAHNYLDTGGFDAY
ncbi:tRNA (pseudouridine(54)-N(1))-methyltransferase TrmY [Natronomonas sp. F2-12]|jgi:tRNA (pseudouridine54-N1)-methyltransferase|uniref:tRNA (pseudouridine(54)-N(1))-methyltransferase n=1 Tax=Natronomonas aquatica TaxID=2841590 RepID=A0A9R1D6B1_9EURY|nr:tRNA (pseudouridine(54)-N(1))-methyltransferase TrmY [Natronomonas aquatica]MCQ4333178.1 tRNA (pseudouridine(54)-N(1))-methyltransferase TrmY [Natronomonas aquatica]